VDTGPLVAFLAAGSEHHGFVCEHWKRLAPPLLAWAPVDLRAAFDTASQ